MRTILIVLAILAASIVAGCATVGDTPGTPGTLLLRGGLTTEARKALDGLTAPEKQVRPNPKLEDELIVSLKQTVAECKKALLDEARKADRGNEVGLGIAIVGLVSGAVIAPALVAKGTAAKSTVAAWSGVAGATNTLQDQFKSRDLTAEAAKRRADAVRDAIAKRIAAFNTATSIEGKQTELLLLSADCVAQL